VDEMKDKMKKYVKKILKIFSKIEMRVLPGNIAFFAVLALIPIITIIIFIASYFSISIDSLIQTIGEILPYKVSEVVIGFISGEGFDSSLGTFNIFAFIIASNGTYAIINASNALYKVEKTDAVKDRIKSIILLIVLISLIIFLLLVPMFGGKILGLFGSNAIVEELKLIYKILKWPTTFLIIYCNLKLIYTIAPSAKIKSKDTTYGALFTTAIWTIATAIFSYYIHYFARYDIIYGNLSSIIMLMMWIYILAYVFVMGMAINTINSDNSNKNK
jgi:membrane protein